MAPGTHPRPHHRRAVQELWVLHEPPGRHRRRHPARRGGRPPPAGQPQRLQGVEGVRRGGCRRQDHEDRRRRLSGHRARDAVPPPQRRRTARLESGPQQVPQADPRPRTSSPADDWRSASVPAGTSRKSGAYGIELGTHRQRSDRFEEACEVLIGLLSQQETITFKGSCYEPTDARCNPKPVQQPHPPICIGGVGRHADSAPRPESPSTGTSTVAHQNGSAGRGTCCTSTVRTSVVTRRRSCCPAKCSSPATGSDRPQQPRLSTRQARSSRSSTCVRRTHRPCWSRWPARCRSCAEAARSPCSSATERLLKRAHSRVTRRGN